MKCGAICSIIKIYLNSTSFKNTDRKGRKEGYIMLKTAVTDTGIGMPIVKRLVDFMNLF